VGSKTRASHKINFWYKRLKYSEKCDEQS